MAQNQVILLLKVPREAESTAHHLRALVPESDVLQKCSLQQDLLPAVCSCTPRAQAGAPASQTYSQAAPTATAAGCSESVALARPLLADLAHRRFPAGDPLVPDSQKTPPWASKGSWERPASPSPSQMRRTPGPSASVHQSPRCAGLWVLGVRSSLSSWGKQIGKKKGRKEERREEGESMQKAWKVLGFLWI